MLMSDGRSRFADSYRRGPRGFVEAVWDHIDTDTVFEMPVPNNCLNNISRWMNKYDRPMYAEHHRGETITSPITKLVCAALSRHLGDDAASAIDASRSIDSEKDACYYTDTVNNHVTEAIFGELDPDDQAEFKDIGKAMKTIEVKDKSVAITRKRDGAMPFAGKRRRSYELGKWEDVTCDTCFGVAGQIRYITDPPSWCLRVIDPAMGKWGIKLPHFQMLRYTPERTSEWAYQKVRRMRTCCPVERKID